MTLDLTGLPPTPGEVAAFLGDDSPDAYEKAVDRLLASPRYGERMAATWLAAARFADSSGFFADQRRDMSRWRDWVIDAFNRNLPFDRFTIEQLAGDLLPDATLEQRIATGFNRNHRMNSEMGIIPQEFFVESVVDRVSTTGTVWLGLTVGCARCHDHKFDPDQAEGVLPALRLLQQHRRVGHRPEDRQHAAAGLRADAGAAGGAGGHRGADRGRRGAARRAPAGRSKRRSARGNARSATPTRSSGWPKTA